MKLLDELKKPFNFFNFILTIFSILLSIYFYYKSEKEKDISYLINEPSLIYDSQNSVPVIKIYEKDSIPIRENIYLINGMIWNSGDFSILKSDIREPLTLNLLSKARILDFKVTKQSDKSISKFILEKKTNQSLQIGWRYFDPGSAFKFQIIYIGKDTPNLKFDGKVLDLKKFTEVDKPDEVTPQVKIWSICLMAIFLLYGIFTFYRDRNRFSLPLILVDSLLVLLPLSMLIYLAMKYLHQLTPQI